MKKLPPELSYSKITPIAFPSLYKEWTLSPMSSNKQWANNDVVRFLFQNLGNGVFDPYRSYIQITVATNEKDHPVGLLQVDGSALSFIEQLILYSNNAEVQRITHCSVLCSYLNDIGLNQFVAQGRQMEGLGYSSFSTPPYERPQSSNCSFRYNGSGNTPLSAVSPPVYTPTIGKGLPYSGYTQNGGEEPAFNSTKTAKGHILSNNPYIFPNDIAFPQSDKYTNIQTDMMYRQGYLSNMRGQYIANYENQRFIDATSSIPNVCLGVDSSVHQGNYPYAYDKSIPYKTVPYNTLEYRLQGQSNQDSKLQKIPVTCANIGFGTLFSPLFSKGTFQPFISATVPQNQISNGLIQKTKTPVSFRRFKIPLPSGIMGFLIDKSSFMLIPLQAINSALLELTLDPYAMFTSGYCDYSEADSIGMGVQQKRDYTITRIQYKLQTYHYPDSEVNQYIYDSLVKQISFTSTMWALGNNYQIAGGTPINNNYIVASNSLFLSQIICLFVPNDYQTKSFCRKTFRISNCVTKYWARVGMDYMPPQPYKGNGGNPYPSINDYDSDNSIFVENLYWANQYMFDVSSPMPRINPYNFAINERPYDVTNKNTFYPNGMLNNPNYTFQSGSFNFDTALGMSWIHENRCVGKAAYIIPFAPYANKDQLLQGINVNGLSNLEVIFEVDTQNVFPRDQSLYIFCKSSVAVSMSPTKIRAYGR